MDLLEDFKITVKKFDGSFFMHFGILNQIKGETVYNVFIVLEQPNDESIINITCLNNIEKLNKGIFVKDYIWAKECLEFGAENDVETLINDIKTKQVEIDIKLK